MSASSTAYRRSWGSVASKRPTRKQQHAKVRREAAKRYEQMLAGQDGHCALCPSTGGTRRLHIDHDHRSMKVRGLLCFRHNVMLRGYMTPEVLRAAADYLENPPWSDSTMLSDSDSTIDETTVTPLDPTESL